MSELEQKENAEAQERLCEVRRGLGPVEPIVADAVGVDPTIVAKAIGKDSDDPNANAMADGRFLHVGTSALAFDSEDHEALCERLRADAKTAAKKAHDENLAFVARHGGPAALGLDSEVE